MGTCYERDNGTTGCHCLQLVEMCLIVWKWDLQILPWRILRNRRPMWIWKVGCHKNESNFHIIFSPCGPHGTCESNPTDLSPLEFKCVCQDGYLGSRCDIETNECIPGMYEIFDLIRFWNNETFSTRNPQTCKFLSHTNCLSEEYLARYSSSYIAWFGMMKIWFKEKKLLHINFSSKIQYQTSWKFLNQALLLDPCQNGATCVDGFLSYTCLCVEGSTGNFSSQIKVAFKILGYNCEIDVPDCVPVQIDGQWYDKSTDLHESTLLSKVSEQMRN